MTIFLHLQNSQIESGSALSVLLSTTIFVVTVVKMGVYGPFSGVTISFVTQERGGFKSSNFTVSFLFVTLKTR